VYSTKSTKTVLINLIRRFDTQCSQLSSGTGKVIFSLHEIHFDLPATDMFVILFFKIPFLLVLSQCNVLNGQI